MKKITVNNDHVMCPNCAHQFHAMSVNARAEMAALKHLVGEPTAWMRPIAKGLPPVLSYHPPKPGDKRWSPLYVRP